MSFYNAIRYANWLLNGSPTDAQDNSATEVKAITKALGNDHILSILATRSGLALPAGETVELGSAQIDSWYRELIFRDSPLGREFRHMHRQELLELAIRSLGPIEKKELAEEDKDLSQVLGALQSVLQQNANTAGKWPIPHLKFVFLDQHDGNTEPSLALEFWRYFDALVDTIPSLTDVVPFRSHQRSV